MEAFDDNKVEPLDGEGGRGSTLTAIILMSCTALALSWLLAYAVTDALVAADVMARWRPDADPRPQIMLKAFGGLMGALTLAGAAAKLMSARQLRQIDRMAEEG